MLFCTSSLTMHQSKLLQLWITTTFSNLSILDQTSQRARLNLRARPSDCLNLSFVWLLLASNLKAIVFENHKTG